METNSELNGNREKREPYANNSVVNFDSLDKAKYFKKKINFIKNNDMTAEKIIEGIKWRYTNNSRVWLLFARKKDNKNWDCVQVAQSRENIQSEIKLAIEHIFSEFNPSKVKNYKNSAFYKKVCPDVTKKEDYHECLYSKIGSEYMYFKICLLNVDKYLGLPKSTTAKKNDAERIINICKNQYAEAKIAYQTLSIYWRKTSCGVDGQTILYIKEHEKDFQYEIQKLLLNS